MVFLLLGGARCLPSTVYHKIMGLSLGIRERSTTTVDSCEGELRKAGDGGGRHLVGVYWLVSCLKTMTDYWSTYGC